MNIFGKAMAPDVITQHLLRE